MTTLQTPEVFRDLWKTVLASGLMAVVLGVVVLIWPGKSILVAAVLFGAYLVVSGIAQVAFALTLDVSAGSRVLMLISGALSVVLGVLAFRHFGGGYAVMLLAIWIGVGFIFQGVAESVLAISHRELPGRGWHIFLGTLTVIAGMIVITWPFDSIVVLAIVAGSWLVVIGLCQIIWAFQARKTVEHTAQGFQTLAGAAR
ncbi:HdeD family acid-resistance protein [Mycobacterium sp.]|uniref:HdeD family acid-resistance protein n=1 Tax=Mycobacterium sp. TaxID=1785 RepID=UPI0025FAECC6|nr:HdeD family acid-resistance protein [Mycobacterium sp.]MBW0013964.1 HdeD family acid-resistance protein [Mycobacterium sp.]